MAMFYISGLTLICGTFFYAAFASGEIQPWADEDGDDDSDDGGDGKTDEKTDTIRPKKHNINDVDE